MQTPISIVGGGIAGLTTAFALQNMGISVKVFEAASEIKAAGAGLALGANAIKAFEKLGIAQEVTEAGRQLSAFTIYDDKGKLLTRTNTERLSKKYGVNNFTIHRSVLHKVLLSKLDTACIVTGKRSKDIQQEKEGYSVLFDDGSELETNCLIVAEGINSPIRQKLLPGTRLRYSGYTCWRGVVNNSSLQIDETSETWGTKGRFGIVPMANNTVYWFACINAEANSEAFKSFKIKNLLDHFEDFHSPIPQILSDTAEEALIWGDINDLEPIDQYAFGNAVLIGDAAHATTPNMGQGACQALEDAVILSREIQRSADMQSAFKSFEKKRLKRTHFIVKRSYQIGKIAQERNPLLAGLRNMVLRLIPQKINEKQLEFL